MNYCNIVILLLICVMLVGSVSQVDVISHSAMECKLLVDGIHESLTAEVHQVIKIVSTISVASLCTLLANFCTVWDSGI